MTNIPIGAIILIAGLTLLWQSHNMALQCGPLVEGASTISSAPGINSQICASAGMVEGASAIVAVLGAVLIYVTRIGKPSNKEYATYHNR